MDPLNTYLSPSQFEIVHFHTEQIGNYKVI